MKKALTIYIDDDAELTNICAAIICWKGSNNSLTMLNEHIPDSAEGFYLPFDKQPEPTRTKWISKDSIVQEEFAEMEREQAQTIDIGTRIKHRLLVLGMTQKELAQKCKVTEVSVSRYMNNARVPRANTLVVLAKALQTTVGWLCGVEGAE